MEGDVLTGNCMGINPRGMRTIREGEFEYRDGVQMSERGNFNEKGWLTGIAGID